MQNSTERQGKIQGEKLTNTYLQLVAIRLAILQDVVRDAATDEARLGLQLLQLEFDVGFVGGQTPQLVFDDAGALARVAEVVEGGGGGRGEGGVGLVGAVGLAGKVVEVDALDLVVDVPA